jgi:hypothetical protein
MPIKEFAYHESIRHRLEEALEAAQARRGLRWKNLEAIPAQALPDGRCAAKWLGGVFHLYSWANSLYADQ